MSRSMDLNVIPLGSGDKGKAPSCGGGWEDPANFKKNNDLVKTRKSKMYGVLCGKHNNLIVIDYDTHKLEETSINPKSLKGVHGSGAYIVQTQSGGFHVYHTYEDKYDSWKGVCGIDGYIDIRTTNNYVVGAGSTGYKLLSGNIEKLTPMPDIIFKKLDGDISSMREKKTKRKSKSKSKKVHDLDEADALVEHLEDFGFTNVEFRWDNSPYNFTCDQVGGGVTCINSSCTNLSLGNFANVPVSVDFVGNLAPLDSYQLTSSPARPSTLLLLHWHLTVLLYPRYLAPAGTPVRSAFARS